ncbi:hypothetical protein I3760_03G182300 [Carya illinoinensis]|nr:hypothetical protein I3760_03G182300 [Carya illinoinensis]
MLNSMPIHMLSVMNIPKGVISGLKKILSNFLWGYSAENKKRKWISWKQICLPVEEGGLGGTMWFEFFASKYVGNDHVLSVMQKNRGTRFWKGIIAIMPKVLSNSKWLIREGNVNFWMENWLGDGPLLASTSIIGDEKLQVKDVFDASGPILNRIQPLVNDASLAKIVAVGVRLKSRPNICVWKHTINGEFTTKSAWQLIRNRGAEWIPKKMSFFVWRARKRAIPIDDVIRRLGIPIASKCECCEQAKAESFNHLLCEGEGSQAVWQFFADACHINIAHIRSWEGMMYCWWNKTTMNSQVGWIRGSLPIIISWSIWRARCEARMEGGEDRETMKRLACPVIPISPKSVKLIAWRPPNRGRIKLNVDGSSCGNPGPAGGGGILRDYRGDVIGGESDSAVIVGWLASGICKYWFLWDFWDEVQLMVRELNVHFRHIYREANMVADFLAKQGARGLTLDFTDASKIHGQFRGLVRLDKIGMPYLRR